MATDKAAFNRFFHAMLDARRLLRAVGVRGGLRVGGARRRRDRRDDPPRRARVRRAPDARARCRAWSPSSRARSGGRASPTPRRRVAAQTHRPLEWVVVDAAGAGSTRRRRATCRCASSARASRCRARARRTSGSTRRAGARALILDDDDLLRAARARAPVRGARRAARRACRVRRRARRRRGRPRGRALPLRVLRAAGRAAQPVPDPTPRWSTSRSSARPACASTRASTGTRTGSSGSRCPRARASCTFARRSRSTARTCRNRACATSTAAAATRGSSRSATLVLARGAARRAALDARHDALKRERAAHEAAGRLPQAAAALGRGAPGATTTTPSRILRYAELASRAGDARAARAIVESGLALLPAEPALHRVARDDPRARGRPAPAPPRRIDRAAPLEARGPVSPI